MVRAPGPRNEQARGTLALVAVALLFGTGHHLTKPLLAPQAVALGADVVSAGVVVAAQGVGGLLAALTAGAVMDRIGGRRVMAAGAVVFAAGAGVMTAATSPEVLAAGNLVFGGGGVATWLAAQTLSTVARDDASTSRRIARVSTAGLVGQLCGPTLGGMLADAISVRMAFAAAAVAGVVLLPATLAHPRTPPHRGRTTATTATDAYLPGASTRALLTRRGLPAVVCATAIATSLQNIRQAFLPLYLDGLGWSSTEVGMILSIAGLGAVLSRAGLTMLDRRLGPAALITLCLLPGALTLGASVSVESVVLVAVIVAISGFSLGLAQPVTLLQITRITAQNERGRAVGIRIAANRIMQAAVPVAFGAVAGLMGLLTAFWFVSATCAVGGGAVAWSFRRLRR
ncbi:MAG: MFS transporter [Propionibacteriales bacterium]|nr:MFS transporter [Propionibacteriales bacterium]